MAERWFIRRARVWPRQAKELSRQPTANSGSIRSPRPKIKVQPSHEQAQIGTDRLDAVCAQRAAHGRGFLFLQHGMQKLFGYPSAPPGGKPPLASLYGVAGTVEFFGGILIMLGLLTRPVAFLLSGQMAFAYFTVHVPKGFGRRRTRESRLWYSASSFCCWYLPAATLER